MPLQSINPANHEVIATYDEMNSEQVREILRKAGQAQRNWARTAFSERAVCLRRVADLLKSRSGEWARLMALEMGKPLAQGKAEAEKCATGCEFYADNAERFLDDEAVQGTPAARAFVRYQPIGTILAIMPWNFPFWQLFRAAAPALMAGNAVLLKHSSNVSGCALAIEQIIRDAGVPEGLFRTLLIGAQAAENLVADDAIAGVTLTGSERAGRVIGSAAGRALKPSVLELGGSDPFVVLPDADLDRTSEQAAQARCQNSGQSCIASKRFIVTEPIYDRFLERFIASMSALKMGDPLEDGVYVGPQARSELRDELHKQVEQSVAAGASVALGGTKSDQAGAWYPPSILTGVKPGMPAYDEELFGPVAAVIRAKDADDALRIANDTKFGLGASVWTSNPDGTQELIDGIAAGLVFVNDYERSDARLPFGGVKSSGYGRELSHHGIHEWVNAKTVWIR